MELEDVTWTELSRRPVRDTVLVIPVGSCEQHGPHLPLNTDSVIAAAVARRLAAIRPEVVVGPTVPIGNSGEHVGFPGTLSVSSSALASYLLEIGRCAVRTPDRPGDHAGIVFVSGHGGNAAAVSAAVARLRAEGRPATGWLPTVSAGDAHAGETETSLMMALDPDLVRYLAVEVGATAPLSELLDEIRVSGIGGVSENGVLGDPRTATSAIGAGILEAWDLELAAIVDQLQIDEVTSPFE